MNLDVAINFAMAVVPKEVHEQLLKLKQDLLDNAPLSFCAVNEQAVKVVNGLEGIDYSMRELAILFYMWGVAASYASLDPFVAESSRQVAEAALKPKPKKRMH